MSDLELSDAVAHITGEDSHEIRRRGFVLTGPEDSGPEPECLLDVLLVDLDELGTVDWDAVLGDGGFLSPFYTRAKQARRNFGAKVLAVELYDYNIDPLERENLAGKTEYAGVLASQQALFDRLLPDLPKRASGHNELPAHE